MVYDPKSHEGHSLTSVAKGVFVFVSGEIAANNPDAMMVKTPVMVIGVRGTKVAGVANPEGEENKVALLADEDGTVGTVVVTNDAGSVVLDAANEMTKILFGNVAPAVPEIVTQLIIDQVFGDTLSYLPLLSEIGAATGLFDAIGGMFGGGSSEPQQGDQPADDNQNSDDGGGFFDSILPHAGGSDDESGATKRPGNGSWLEPLAPSWANDAALGLGYTLWDLGLDDHAAGSPALAPPPLPLV